MTQSVSPSLRSQFSDRLLEAACNERCILPEPVIYINFAFNIQDVFDITQTAFPFTMGA